MSAEEGISEYRSCKPQAQCYYDKKSGMICGIHRLSMYATSKRFNHAYYNKTESPMQGKNKKLPNS